MKLNDYQSAALATSGALDDVVSLRIGAALGVAGEAGECADLVKKEQFHGHAPQPEKMLKELGDVLWYVAALAYAYGFDLQTIAEANIAKLRARYPEGFSAEASINRKVD